MGWGIDFKADVYLSRQSYRSKQEVADRMEELDKEINDHEVKLKMIGIANPNDIVPTEEDKVFWVNREISDVLEEYRASVIDRYNLYLYLDYLNEGGEIVETA